MYAELKRPIDLLPEIKPHPADMDLIMFGGAVYSLGDALALSQRLNFAVLVQVTAQRQAIDAAVIQKYESAMSGATA